MLLKIFLTEILKANPAYKTIIVIEFHNEFDFLLWIN